jgi:hypothetical protein
MVITNQHAVDVMDEIEVAGHRIAYARKGQGPPLVLLHGWPMDSREWRRQIDGLSDEFSVLRGTPRERDGRRIHRRRSACPTGQTPLPPSRRGSGSDDSIWEGSPGAGGSPLSSTVGIQQLSAR